MLSMLERSIKSHSKSSLVAVKSDQEWMKSWRNIKKIGRVLMSGIVSYLSLSLSLWQLCVPALWTHSEHHHRRRRSMWITDGGGTCWLRGQVDQMADSYILSCPVLLYTRIQRGDTWNCLSVIRLPAGWAAERWWPRRHGERYEKSSRFDTRLTIIIVLLVLDQHQRLKTGSLSVWLSLCRRSLIVWCGALYKV